MGSRLASATVVSICLLAGVARAQAPALTKPQRDLLQALVLAVDAAQSQPESTDVTWQSHVMRASDGSHYVAFSIEPAADRPLPTGPAMLYIRLASSSAGTAQPIIERSAIREWLAGTRTDPRMLPKRNIAIGDMPIMGPGGLNTQRPVTSTGGNELRLMALERERARQAKEDQDKQRKAELEGRSTTAHELLPFEDFDLASRSVLPNGARIVTRALTAGPGDYDLFVAWADPAAPKGAAPIRVVRKPLRLLAARTAGLSTSSIIFADSVSARPAPYPASEQSSHPYSIGSMEIVPSRTPRYGREGNIALAFQIINAESTEAGMPDISVEFRIMRLAGERETQVATLKPQVYNATTLPADFNLRLGHPLFAAVTAPLASLARGDYRVKIQVSDRIANSATSIDGDFSIAATPASLLAEAPSLGPAFTRDPVFEPSALGAIVDALSPSAPSPALARALSVARTGRLVDLLVEEPVQASEAGIRTALTGLAYLSIGNASAAAQFQRALLQNAPLAVTQFLLGCSFALQSRDPDAVTAWQSAIGAGSAPALAKQFLLEAYLRRNDVARATDVARTAEAMTPTWVRLTAATHILARRDTDAVALVTTRLAAAPDDQDARWLLLHALYSQFVRSGAPLPGAEAERFAKEARTYIDAKGINAGLAAEWLRIISSS